jgi:signal transduction histidine kinase
MQPDLILMDIGLPALNGIEAARQIRDLSTTSKILFVSENRSWDMAEEALRTGEGYVVKSDAGRDLLPAINAVLDGKRSVSASVKGRDSGAPVDERATMTTHCPEVAFYPGETSLVDGYALEASIPQASLESILCTEELHRRPPRPPDYEKENRELVALVSALADSPRSILQTLAETILDITRCDSAGLSLLTRDGNAPDVSGQRFYWPAIAGMWSPNVGGGTPRDFGPCGDVLDQNRTLLFRHFERRYPYLLPVIPAAEECLLVPFHVHGKAVGTIWAIMHSDRRKFDSEDNRVMNSLGKFASSAYQALVSVDDLKFQVAVRERAETELRELTDSLEGQVRARTAELQRSEAYLAKAQAVSHTGSFGWQVASGRLYWSAETFRIFEFESTADPTLEQLFERTHPEDRQFVRDMVDKASRERKDFDYEHRLLMADGSVKFVRVRGHSSSAETGDFEFLGAVTDITERKRAERALSSMTRKLVEAQEQERARIARELHDDINQRLAMLATELEQLHDKPSDVTSRVHEFRKQVIEISNGVQALSHDLHSSNLEYLGVVAGMRGWCKEFEERQKLEVDFRSNVASVLSPQVSLSLFRVLQEALHNAVKHSGARRFEVQLREDFGEIHLVISDFGKGFDVQAALQGKGLGLTSMRERVRLVNGAIAIESKLMGGTTIHVRVPFGSEKLSKRAVG